MTQEERDLEEISQRHEKLIQTILNEEEYLLPMFSLLFLIFIRQLINLHRKHIDDTVELTK